jgi:ElaB/YqjD/DUF883 family membrane-anchored ribosome-binding protein
MESILLNPPTRETPRKMANEIGEKARDVAEDLAAAGRTATKKYEQLAARGKRTLSRATKDVSRYADDNTALVAAGAFAVGLLVGYLVSRK